MKSLLFLLVSLTCFGQMFPGPGGNVTIAASGSCGGSINGFTHCRKLTIDHTQVSSTLTNFTVVLNTTIANLKSTGSGGSVTDAQGDDIVFTSDNTCTTMINWDPLEAWNSSTGAITAWIKIASVSSSADTDFYICYGKAAITTFQGGSAGAAWDSNFRGVWHLSDNAATTTVVDSTGHANGTNQVNTSTVTVAGQEANALNYANSTDYTTTTDAGFTSTNTWTVCAWINPLAQRGTIMRNDDSGNATYFQVSATAHLIVGPGVFLTGSTAMTPGTWYHACVVSITGTSTTVYLNGVSDGTTATVTPWNTQPSEFGGDPFSTNMGKLDELELSNTNRSVDWISAAYNNTKSGTTFITVGSES